MSERLGEAGPWAGALLEKYADMLRLRRGDRDGSIIDPRPAMGALAARFPGALREIDQLALEELERRHEHLLRVVAGDPPQAWAVAMAGYHRWLRGALGAKRWLAGRRGVTEALVARFVSEAPGLVHGDELLVWSDALGELAAPPGGRLLPLVLARLAVDTGETEATLRGLLFVPRQKSSSSGSEPTSSQA